MTFDIDVTARTVWMEARGTGDEGMRAVAHAIVNRQRAGKWYSGKNLAETCLLPSQFSCWNTNDPNREEMAGLAEDDPLLARCVGFVTGAVAGADPDPTDGATHYFSNSIKPPVWAQYGTKTAEIGRQIFYKGVN